MQSWFPLFNTSVKGLACSIALNTGFHYSTRLSRPWLALLLLILLIHMAAVCFPMSCNMLSKNCLHQLSPPAPIELAEGTSKQVGKQAKGLTDLQAKGPSSQQKKLKVPIGVACHASMQARGGISESQISRSSANRQGFLPRTPPKSKKCLLANSNKETSRPI